MKILAFIGLYVLCCGFYWSLVRVGKWADQQRGSE